MVGLIGILNDHFGSTSKIENSLHGSEEPTTSTYRTTSATVHMSFHSQENNSQPVWCRDGEVQMWLLGEVYGFQDESGYTPRPSSMASVEFCASLYERLGWEFLTGLNGNFVGIVYDHVSETASIFLDRFGTHPVFYAQFDGILVFSTQIQLLPSFSQISRRFDHEYLFEYFTLRRVFGTKTPLRDIEKFPPASVTTYDLSTHEITSEVYWTPHYQPDDKPFEHFVETFIDVFQDVINERLDSDREPGLMLSGGSDSRLILAATNRQLTAFHLAGWHNREARIAERVAEIGNTDLRILHRTDTTYLETLPKNASLSNFDGYYFQGYLTPFADEITESVDSLFTGLYADTLFKSYPIPDRSQSLGSLGTLTLPIGVEMNSLADILEYWISSAGTALASPPEYLTTSHDLHEILSANVVRDDGKINHHGIRYDSLDDLLVCSTYYPLSNDSELINLRSLRQLCPSHVPFLDNRLVDLHLRIPKKYRLRRDLINRAVQRLAPELAAIPHPSSDVPIARSYPVQYLGRQVASFRRKHLPRHQPPKYHLNQDSWRDHARFARHEDFVIDAIRKHEPTIRELPFLDWEGVKTVYRKHRNGENRTAELYTLLTLLEMPIIKQATMMSQMHSFSPSTAEESA